MISTYLCNPFQGCIVWWACVPRVPTPGLPAVTGILPIPGKIRESSIALRDDSSGNIRLGSLSVSIAALNRRLHKDDALSGNELSAFRFQFSVFRKGTE
ncbi:MAG: hypothetical protein K2G47_05965 [Muribaculum sp.]|nr:hypothetical protein [Muribaculum sp.]